MALYPAYSASLLAHNTQSSDKTNNDDLHHLHPRYACGLAHTDCGNGYCCDAAHQCVLPSSSSGQTLCRLPGFSTANAVATLASDVTTTGSATATTTADSSTAASVTACSGDGDCVVVSNGGYTSSSSTNSSSGVSLSAGAIAGIAIGAFIVVALVVGAIVFLLCVRRRRRKRTANDAAVAGVAETGYGRPPHVYQPVPGGGGIAPLDMYAGSNVGKMQDRVPGRAEMMGDMAQRPVVQELPGDEVTRPVELDSGAEKKGSY
ncbi:hypothetical protein DIS24_g4823 [Lasiodiplodia hormozganensis]|uniref:Uncharacterized protein n=1 Tax=Lasiodiplodia hormozganensis TaxID=869390 RepID=A0AA40D1K7_9PEZI|nr:hypothetical protein DIS24_g4823 [Lasiodiplodia hormozganensis]